MVAVARGSEAGGRSVGRTVTSADRPRLASSLSPTRQLIVSNLMSCSLPSLAPPSSDRVPSSGSALAEFFRPPPPALI